MAHIVFWIVLLLYFLLVNTKVTYYFVTERPVITHMNPRYISYANFTSARKNRRSPMYYVDLHYQQLVYADDSFKERNILLVPLVSMWVAGVKPFYLCQVDFYFYQLLSNEYKRSFVEMHFGWCTLIHKDPFFGAAMRQGKLEQPCPFPPGDYHMYNMSIPSAVIPPGFPFEKGRIFANMTHHGIDVVGGHIDMELKEKRTRD